MAEVEESEGEERSVLAERCPHPLVTQFHLRDLWSKTVRVHAFSRARESKKKVRQQEAELVTFRMAWRPTSTQVRALHCNLITVLAN